MITHIVLFKLKDGVDRDSQQVTEAVEHAHEVGRQVPELVDWRAGWNTVDRDISYDFAAIGVLADLPALQRYQENAFHQLAIEKWKLISDWIVADLEDH